MHEALSALLDYAFTELNLNRVEADTDPRNERSARLLARLKFLKEGSSVSAVSWMARSTTPPCMACSNAIGIRSHRKLSAARLKNPFIERHVPLLVPQADPSLSCQTSVSVSTTRR